MISGRAAAQGATVHLPLGQLALVGLGAFAISNPDKFFYTLQKGSQFFLTVQEHPSGSDRRQQHPIVIHQVTNSPGGKSFTGYVVQLVLGAGFCWGSYMVLVNVLPEAAKGMLPVTTAVFSRAVTSLGNAVINLKESMMEQVLGMSKKQDELADRQNQTHEEVVQVKGHVRNLKDDLGQVRNSLDQCRVSLTESERRTSYIARGVQLLTRGVSTILSQDDDLLYELLQFNSAGEEFTHKPALARESCLTIKDIEKPERDLSVVDDGQHTPVKDSEHSLDEVRALLYSVRTLKAGH
jgi:hypothetical protein